METNPEMIATETIMEEDEDESIVVQRTGTMVRADP